MVVQATCFKHETCPGCVYLGPYGDESVVGFDLWFCDQGGTVPTVMARFGDEPDAYHAGINSTMEPMVEAKRRASERGLL